MNGGAIARVDGLRARADLRNTAEDSEGERWRAFLGLNCLGYFHRGVPATFRGAKTRPRAGSLFFRDSERPRA